MNREEIDYICQFAKTDEINSCIEKRKELQLNSIDIFHLIRATDDAEYIKQCIEKREEFELESFYLTRLIAKTNDIDYIKSCVDRREELGLNLYDTFTLVKVCNYSEWSKDFFQSIDKTKSYEDSEHSKKTEIHLPNNMTIGLEIESEGENAFLIEKHLSNLIEDGWLCKHEGTLIFGAEVVSPKLEKDMKNASKSIRKVCNRLQGLGQTVSDRCGGHIHIGVNYLTMEESWNNLGDIWGNTERILFIISNKPGELPRYKVNETAKPFSKVLEKELEDEIGQIENKKCTKKFMMNAQNDRYYAINFKKSDTIEFRLSNGTLDADIWMQNINLFGGLVKAAQDIAIIQTKAKGERTQEEQSLLRNFDRIKQDEVSEYEKFEALLTLVIPKQDRDIYRERYEVNRNLLEQNSELEEKITSGLAKGKIDLSEIGRKVFLEEDGITGEEYRDGIRIIEKDLREEMLEIDLNQDNLL